MKFKGKIAVWFWALEILANAMILYDLIFKRDNIIALVIGGVILNLVFIPIIVRNYVLLNDESITLYFGFGKESIKVNEILEVYQTHNPIASSAASLDRIVIKGRRSEIMCSVKDKTKLIEEIKKINQQIVFRGYF
ncbi:PH domain-containing protein [Robinsoniella sp. KNHs210]|uniref:PH domain-containing protein n=1 Tax=Robinsoniella sp. KNHs210 TaxID=1469950 RepID=UPI00048644DC|nr:PH domain-containing protein [Robinsoniella sp. KNHs210]